MSTGKRLAKRSILGTKVMVPGQDDRLHAGHILAVKTYEDSGFANRYSVRLEDSQRVFEFSEKDIVGQGFRSVADMQLMPGQRVFVTHNQREMQGRVVRHDFDSQDVLLTVNNEEETVLLKIDDVRLLESRKSARLVNSDTDFSKLADIATSSKAIEVPRSDYVQISGSRKRRTSENLPDEEEVLSECSAAMLLMKLSCSPHSPAAAAGLFSAAVPMFRGDFPSTASSSSGASSFRSPTPSPPLSTSATDEGIVKDLHTKQREKQIVFQCTFPGCHEQYDTVRLIECHVRREHMNCAEEVDSDDEDRNHEEEFYYTEIEVDETKPMMASLSLADHLDMARPAHEDPNGGGIFMANGHRKKIVRNSEMNLSRSLPNPISLVPISIAPSPLGSPGKMMAMSPSPRSPHSSGGGGSGVKSPHRRPRDGKKCRKVYGLEQRDQWCTQCKWKKACARFGGGMTTDLSSSNTLIPHSISPTMQNPMLLSPTTTTTAVKAIKF